MNTAFLCDIMKKQKDQISLDLHKLVSFSSAISGFLKVSRNICLYKQLYASVRDART